MAGLRANNNFGQIFASLRPDNNILTPEVQQLLESIGRRIRSTRKLRRITTTRLAADTDISRVTLALIEKGSPGVSVALYFQVMYALGFERYLWELADDEPRRRQLLFRRK